MHHIEAEHCEKARSDVVVKSKPWRCKPQSLLHRTPHAQLTHTVGWVAEHKRCVYYKAENTSDDLRRCMLA
jgi:hypothetical protein